MHRFRTCPHSCLFLFNSTSFNFSAPPLGTDQKRGRTASEFIYLSVGEKMPRLRTCKHSRIKTNKLSTSFNFSAPPRGVDQKGSNKKNQIQNSLNNSVSKIINHHSKAETIFKTDSPVTLVATLFFTCALRGGGLRL